jgi:chorismate synthase
MIRFLTAGESHGQALTTIVDGFPSNLKVGNEIINFHLKRRQAGYGRGLRMKIGKTGWIKCLHSRVRKLKK